ncbi:MAG: hypothetical protein M3Y87_03635 [Myxococcota bacterium]|nr:hypothetical protein [Myxococcota bacterium]
MTETTPRAWVLNFDAELELESGARYTPTDEMRERVRELARRVATTLEEGDLVIAPTLRNAPPTKPTALRGFAWCPTPRALTLLRRARTIVPDAPPVDTLRLVHERGFAFALAGDELPGVLRATDLDAIEAHVAEPGPTGRWLLKRAFGVAGRGQRPVHPARLSDADRAWIAASLRKGAVYVEPRVEIARELSVHCWARGGRADVRSIREQCVRPDGAWLSSDRAAELDASLERAVVDTAERVGRALIDAGYSGPYGVDAYSWRTPTGALALRALSEINPRYVMGWDTRDGWG